MTSRTAPPLTELAEDWLHAKAVTGRSTSGNSDKARRQDLARWGRTLRTVTDKQVDASLPYDVEADLMGLTTRSLSSDNLLAALDLLRRRYKEATLQRSTSTMRAFCRWMVNRGHLSMNPFDDETLLVRHRPEPEVRAFSPDDVEAMLAAAGDPSPTARSAWPRRDVAAIDVLAYTGVRAGEFCALQIGDITTTGTHHLLLIRRATKSGRRREVPLPDHTTDRLDAYLADRADHGLRSGPRTPLFVRNEGTAMSTDALAHLVGRIALAAGATLPDDALVDGLRHHFGLQLAVRGIPPATLQQLMGHTDPRTTALYTRHAGHDLINALQDADWLT